MSEPKRYLYSLEEIKQRLQGRALDLAHVLLPGGSLIGPHWVALNPRRKDTRPGPLVNVRKGVWKDFAGGDKDAGDMLHFVATFATNGDYKKAVPWAKDFLGLTGRAPDPAECARIEAEAKKAREDEERAALKRRRAAQALMHEATPLCGDDPASLYLKARGIDVTKLAQGIPRALRFHPTCMAFPENYPSAAMLAFISREDLPHGFAAVHRTYLENYLGTWRKRRFPDRDGKPMNSKRVLGQYAGGSIRLTKGESKKALKDAPAGEWLTTAEGIENALSVAMAQPKMRVLAHVSGSNLAHLALPEQLGGVYVVQDNDAPNSKAAQQFAKAVETLAQRYELAIVSMDGEYKDANDALLGKRRSA